MPMNCRDIFPHLSPHLDGELSVDVMRSVEAHLLTCAGCRSRQAQLVSARDAVRQWPAESVSSTFGPQLRARLNHAATVTAPAVRHSWSRLRVSAGVALLAGVVLLAISPWRSVETPTVSRSEGTAGLDNALGIDCGLGTAVRCQPEQLLCGSALACGLPPHMAALRASN